MADDQIDTPRLKGTGSRHVIVSARTAVNCNTYYSTSGYGMSALFKQWFSSNRPVSPETEFTKRQDSAKD